MQCYTLYRDKMNQIVVFDNMACLPALFQAFKAKPPDPPHMWGAAHGYFRLGRSQVPWAYSVSWAAWRHRHYLYSGGHWEGWAFLPRHLLGAVTLAALPRGRVRCVAISTVGVILQGRGELCSGREDVGPVPGAGRPGWPVPTRGTWYPIPPAL